MRRSTALWAVAAMLGIALTAGITWATSHLTSQHIGISAEPLTAGSSLAPRAQQPAARSRSPNPHAPTPARTGPAPASPTTSTSPPNTSTAPANAPSSAGAQQTTTPRTTATHSRDDGADGTGARPSPAPPQRSDEARVGHSQDD